MTTSFDHLSAVMINTTLKPSPTPSHTQALMDVAAHIMREQGVEVTTIRAVDHHLAPGVYPDMTEDVEGGNQDRDDWPQIAEHIQQANILVLGTPIWLGSASSVAVRVIERIYAMSGTTNDKGQYQFYGKAAGVISTGNEDGSKHAARDLLYALQHTGFTVPPNADAGWVGEAGPGKSYDDQGSGGPQNEFTQRNTTFLAWNLMHTAAWLSANGGFPEGGNSADAWAEGERFGHPFFE